MKIMSIVRLVLGLFLAICFQQVVLASDNAMVRAIALGQDISVMQPEKLDEDITTATTKMNDARKQLFVEKTQAEDRKNVRIIIEQNSIIVHANYDLRKLNEELEKGLDDSEFEQGYLSKLKDIGSGILGRVKGLYAYTEDEKEIARQLIDGLKVQKAEITRECVAKLKDLNPGLKNQLKIRYQAIMTQLNAEIHKQQVITGEAMSFTQKVAWGTIGAAAATAAGLALADKYSASTPEEEQPSIIKASTTVTELPTHPSEEDFEDLRQMGLAQVRPGSMVVSSEDLEHLRQMRLAQAEPEEQLVLSPADELLSAARQDLEQAENLGAPSLREKDRVKIAEFIKKRLDESPVDPEVLDYLNQLQLADEKIAQIEVKDNEYRERVGWWGYWVGLQPEGIAITDELKAAKAVEVDLRNNILAAIQEKEYVSQQQEKVLEAVDQSEQDITKNSEITVVEEKVQPSVQAQKKSKQQKWRLYDQPKFQMKQTVDVKPRPAKSATFGPSEPDVD